MTFDVSSLDMERIWTDALRILKEIGLQINSPGVCGPAGHGLLVKGDRVCFPAALAEQYAAEIRSRFGQSPPPSGTRLNLFASPLHAWWLDPRDDSIKPQGAADVIRHTRLLGQLADEGLMRGGVAGIPQDAPAELQFLEAHYIDCVYSRRPTGWSLMTSARMARYCFEIADLMGFDRKIGTELISPLKFMGHSIDLAMEFGPRGVAVGVDPIPVMGVTAPADWHLAWAQSVAENMGSYIMFRERGIERVRPPSFRLFPANPMACVSYFSAPENIFALLARRKVRAHFGLATTNAESLLVTSKAPDAQAAMEKTAGCLLARMHDFTEVQGAGALWMDEIFSPQQLMIDLEIAAYVAAMSVAVGGAAPDAVEAMREALRTGSFLDADLTLERFAHSGQKAGLFDLRARGAWDGDAQTLLRKAAVAAEEKAAAYAYELGGERREALERIMARARAEMGGV